MVSSNFHEGIYIGIKCQSCLAVTFTLRSFLISACLHGALLRKH